VELTLASTGDAMQYPEGIDRTLPHEAAVTGIGLRPLPCGRHQHVLPAPLVTRNPTEIKIRSDKLTSRIVLELLDGKHYIQHPAGHLAE
jgi:hypothetical protein